jgi:preprotein translocase subunit Sec61beta
MVKLQRGPSISGPSSSLGIMRFFDVESGGPKVSPEFVVGISIVFAFIILLLKIFS